MQRTWPRHAFRLAKDQKRDRQWHRAVGAVLRDGVQAAVGSPAPIGLDDDCIPVVMCLWNRPERVERILAMLEALDTTHPVRLILWNNNAADAERYRAAVAGWHRVRAAGARGALHDVTLINSPRNFGGLGRFIVARLLYNAGYRGPLVTLDDDQNVAPSFIADLLATWRPQSVVAWWGFRLHGSYWRRSEIEPGTEPDHAGTGGTMIDIALVADDRFFARLPHRYTFLEDQWMTFVARRKGWRIVKGRTDIELVSEEKNQYHGLKPLKDVFYTWQHTVGPLWFAVPAHVDAWARGRLRTRPPQA